MMKQKNILTLGLLAVIASLAFTVAGCRERIHYDDDYDHGPDRDRHYDRDDWDGDRTLNGTGRILFGNKGCNMSRVTAYWDGNRRARESNIPDKDGYFIIRDLPRGQKILLVAEFDYYSKHYVATDVIRTPRRGKKVNLGVMHFREDDHHRRPGPGPRPGPRPHHRDYVRIQGWVTYKGASIDDVEVFIKSKDRPAWRKVDKTNRVGKFDFDKVPYDEKVDLKFIKTTRRGTYSGSKSIRAKRDLYDVGTIKLRYSEKRDDHRDGRHGDRRDNRHDRGHYRNVPIQGWVTYKGSAIKDVNIYLKSKSSPNWGIVGSTDRLGKFHIRKAPADEKVELKFVKDTRGGTYSANRKFNTGHTLKDIGTVKLKFHERKHKR